MANFPALLSSFILVSLSFAFVLSTASARATTDSLSDSSIQDPSIIHPSVRGVDVHLIAKKCKICMPTKKELCTKVFLEAYKKRVNKEFKTEVRTVSPTNRCMLEKLHKYDPQWFPKPKQEPSAPVKVTPVNPPNFGSTNIKDYFFSRQFDQRTNARIYGRLLELLLPRNIDPVVRVSLVPNNVPGFPFSVYPSYPLKCPSIRTQLSKPLSMIRSAITSSVPAVVNDITDDDMALLHMSSRQSVTCMRSNCSAKVDVYTNEKGRDKIVRQAVVKIRGKEGFITVFQEKTEVIRRGESWWTVILYPKDYPSEL